MMLIGVIGAILVIFGLGYVFAPKGWRTVTTNALLAVSAVAVAVLDWLTTFDFSTVTDDPKIAATALLVVNVLNIVLRGATTTPLGKPD